MAWGCLTLGIYTGIRILYGHMTRNLVMQWVAYQAGALCIYAWLFPHISMLRGSAFEAGLHYFFKESYFSPATDDPFTFGLRQTTAVLRYLFEVPAVSVLAAILLAGALVWLAAARDSSVSHPRFVCLLLVTPPAIGYLMAMLDLNPFGYSRHSAIFQLFLAAGVGYGIALLLGKRIRLLVMINLLLIPPWILVAYKSAWYMPGRDETRAQMAAAMSHLRTLPQGATIIADHASLIELGYYLGRDVYSPYHGREDPLIAFYYGGYRVLSMPANWFMRPADLMSAVTSAKARYGLKPSEIWVFDNCQDNLGATTQTQNLQWFGKRISVFQPVD
jgi:hypothetical protein